MRTLYEITATAQGGRHPLVQAQELLEAAHAVCPFSNMVRGNIGVALDLA